MCSFATVTRYSWSILINFVIGNSALELFSRVICYLQLSQHRHSQLKSDKDKARPCLYCGFHSVNKSCCGLLFCFQLQALMTVCSRWQMNTHIHMLQKLIPSSNICLSGSIDRAKMKCYDLSCKNKNKKSCNIFWEINVAYKLCPWAEAISLTRKKQGDFPEYNL